VEKREHSKGRELYFFMVKETKFINWEQNFLYTKRILSAIKREEFFIVSISQSADRCYNIIVLNVHAPSKVEK
jgi:hypothetical protein